MKSWSEAVDDIFGTNIENTVRNHLLEGWYIYCDTEKTIKEFSDICKKLDLFVITEIGRALALDKYCENEGLRSIYVRCGIEFQSLAIHNILPEGGAACINFSDLVGAQDSQRNSDEKRYKYFVSFEISEVLTKINTRDRIVVEVSKKIEELNTVEEMSKWLKDIEKIIKDEVKYGNIVILNYKFIN